MFSKSVVAPFSNLDFSLDSAENPLIIRIPEKVSFSRPFTSASILPLSLKIGRTVVKALNAMRAKSARGAKLKRVIGRLSRMRNTNATAAVNNPPIS